MFITLLFLVVGLLDSDLSVCSGLLPAAAGGALPPSFRGVWSGSALGSSYCVVLKILLNNGAR